MFEIESCEKYKLLYKKWNTEINSMFYGHALTEEHVSKIIKSVWTFIVNNDLKSLFDDLYLREYINVNGKIIKRSLVLVSDINQELNVRQIEALGYRVLWNMKLSV